MIKLIINQIILLLLLLLFLSSTAFAVDKPVWTVDHKLLNLPEIGKPVSYNKWATVGLYDKPNPNYNIHFTLDNKILVSFLHYRTQTEIKPNDKSKKFDTFFVALLLSRENGELIRRVEWPLGESTQIQRIGYGSCIYPLKSGAYMGIINQHLQVFDSSFNIIYNRVLNTLEPGGGMYYLIMPLSGKYIILWRQKSATQFERIIEIIDSDTFKTMELFEIPSLRIMDIWEDRLLAIGYFEDTCDSYYLEKKIGTEQWNALGLTQGSQTNAKFIYNGDIIVTDNIGLVHNKKGFWFMIEAGKKSDPVFGGFYSTSKLSWNTPTIASKINNQSAIRRLFDLFGKNWVESYDLSTRKVLLKTKAYSQDSISGEEMVDYAISPDGDSIILMTNKKIELYTVNPKKIKKK